MLHVISIYNVFFSNKIVDGGEQRPLVVRKVDGRAGGRSSFSSFAKIFSHHHLTAR